MADAVIKGNNEEVFSVDYSSKKAGLYDANIAGTTIQETFQVDFATKADAEIGQNENIFLVNVWEPIPIKEARQLYEGIYLIRWNQYDETPLSEFMRYELHRSTTTFTPAPGDPTKIFESTINTDTHYFDDTGNPTQEFFYRVITILIDGRYNLSPEETGNRIPTFALWPDALIKNNGGDAVSQDSAYECECEEALDPDLDAINYYFQHVTASSTPEFPKGWSFTFGPDSDPYNRFIQVENRKIYTDAPYGVWVNSVLWTYAGAELADLSGYGPLDEVYVYDPIHDVIIFGDNTNGKTPSYGDTIEADISNWTDITTATALTEKIQQWDVPALFPPGVYWMRVFAADPSNPTLIKSYVDVSEVTFAVIATLPPILIHPIGGEIVNTFRPVFQFYGESLFGSDLKYKFQVFTDPLDPSGSLIQEFDQTSNPSEWGDPQYLNKQLVDFVPPSAKLIHDPTQGMYGNGTFYWRAAAYDVAFGAWSAWSITETFNIEGATYKWRVGAAGLEKEFLPAKNGWEVEISQIGREGIEKRMFKVKYAAMNQAKMEELKGEFERREILLLWDNFGRSFQVWWGQSDRTLSGKALPPDNPIFGIKPLSYVPGLLYWGGESIFTEV